MGEQLRRELTIEMRDHEREVSRISRDLARLESTSQPSPKVHQHAVYLTAQMMKHRISLALLASRLGDEPTALAH